jgi:hypothetical protein
MEGREMIGPKGRYLFSIACSIVLLIMSGCAPQTNMAKDFMRTIFAGKAREALVMLCVDGDVNAIVAVHADWSDDFYKVIYEDDDSAQVLVSGRLIISSENLERYFPTIRDALLQQGYQVPDLPAMSQMGAGIQFGVDFDDFYLRHDDLRNKWCVEGKTYYSFLQYLFQMVVNQISKLPQ